MKTKAKSLTIGNKAISNAMMTKIDTSVIPPSKQIDAILGA